MKVTFNCPTELVEQIKSHSKGTITSEFIDMLKLGSKVNSEMNDGTNILLEKQNGKLVKIIRRY
jgi:hypothetical protein